jgi:hypothetical protein
MPTSALPNRRPTINRHDDILDRPSRKPGLQTVTCADYGRFELGDRRGSPPGVKSRGLSHVRRSSTSASHERLGILFAYGVFNSVRTLGLKNSRCLILEFVRNLFARNEDFRTLGNALQETLSQSECGRGIARRWTAQYRICPSSATGIGSFGVVLPLFSLLTTFVESFLTRISPSLSLH